jgi:signal transduction histidine kinase
MDEPLDVVLARAVTDVADRFGAEVELDLASGALASPARTESLLRIACEAVTNAARHSGASRVVVSLHRTGDGLRLRVQDAGCGFDSTAPTRGFGLISMRERARSVGGRLSVASTPGRGTTVEVAM